MFYAEDLELTLSFKNILNASVEALSFVVGCGELQKRRVPGWVKDCRCDEPHSRSGMLIDQESARWCRILQPRCIGSPEVRSCKQGSLCLRRLK